VLETVYAAAARLHYDHVASAIDRHKPDALGVWGGNAVDAKAVVMAARHSGLPCFRFENGFLPDTTQMDLRGVNVESSVPRAPEFYRARGQSSRQLPDHIVPRKPYRGKQAVVPIQLPEWYVFVPFQVQLDSQILLHSPWIQGMRQFFEVVTESAQRLGGVGPALVFKEHPSCPERYPDLHARAAAMEGVYLAAGNATDELIRNAAGVVTINSTVGAESLLLEKPVLALGNAVYEVSGVTSSARSVDQVADWLASVWGGHPPDAPLRRSFVQFLMEDYLVPGRHQQPGPSHIRAVEKRLRRADPSASGVGILDH
jgi:capsular polysaccharide export protein